MLDVLDPVDPAATGLPAPLALSFRLDAAHEAHEPPEATGAHSPVSGAKTIIANSNQFAYAA